MKKAIDSKNLKFYLIVGVVFLFANLIHDFVNYPSTFVKQLFNNLWLTGYVISFNFIFYEYVVSFIFQRKYLLTKILFSLFFFFVLMMLCSFGLFAWRSLGILLHIYTPLRVYASTNKAVASMTGYTVASVFFFGIIRHIYNYIKLQQTTQQLRIEKQQAELNYLKSQTNPHFLFNTLNNIYSLARDKSDLAPESILRLSKILRFMLYETGGKFISIEQELKIIDDYVALEKLRYDASLRVNFHHNIVDMKQALPPLLLIPLVENAFKHGVSETRSEPFVDIHVEVKQRVLTCVVKNSAEVFAVEGGIKENIGISNLRRQLELLFKEYSLTFHQAGSAFTATLKINLASHV